MRRRRASTTRGRRAALVTLVAAAVAMTSACAGLPTTSSVSVGKAVDAQDDSEPLAVEPLTASAYDDPRQIATGFLRAQMSSHDDFAAAHTFLTPAGSKGWKPGASVTVFEGDRDITATRPDTTTVRLSVPVVATIDADGHLTRSAAARRRDLTFKIAPTRDGWRLDAVPADLGVWISDADVQQLFTRVNVYYPSAYGRSLVPDPRLLPRQGLATALARASLSAPPRWLRPAIDDALPRGTGLAVDAVPVRDGAAEVALTSASTSADNPTRAAMWASITATLMQAPEVRSVSLRVGGARLEVDNLPAQVTDPGQVGYTLATTSLDAVISRSGTYLAWAHAQATDAVAGTDAQAASGRPKLPAVPADWSRLAVGQGGRQVAAVSREATSVRRWVNGTDITVEDIGTDLVRPTFDSAGWLWVAGRADDGHGAAWVLDTTSTSPRQGATRLDIPWLGDATIESISMSAEGSRVALTVRDARGSRAVVAAVERDARGRPSALGEPHDVAAGVSGVKDVVWADAASLVVLGKIEGELQPTFVPLDGEAAPLGPVAGATGLVSTMDGRSGLFVRTDKHAVFTRLGSSWNSFLTRGDVIAPRS